MTTKLREQRAGTCRGDVDAGGVDGRVGQYDLSRVAREARPLHRRHLEDARTGSFRRAQKAERRAHRIERRRFGEFESAARLGPDCPFECGGRDPGRRQSGIFPRDLILPQRDAVLSVPGVGNEWHRCHFALDANALRRRNEVERTRPCFLPRRATCAKPESGYGVDE